MKQILVWLLLAYSSFVMGAPEIIFVPGAHFDGDSFQELGSQFQKSSAVNFKGLPGLDAYTKELCKVIKASDDAVVLIGHSQGGAVMNHALGMCSKKIRALIYIAAVIPIPGEKPFELFKSRDDEFYFRGIQQDENSGFFKIINRDLFLEAFAQDSSNEQKKSIKRMMRDEPIGPSLSKVTFHRHLLDSIPKLVISTRHDRVISPETQKAYFDRIPDAEIRFIESGHLPMITKTNEVHAMINSFIRKLSYR